MSKAKESYSLREAVAETGMSSAWLRKQMRKKLDTLVGRTAFKNADGHWRIPASTVQSEKHRMTAVSLRAKAVASGAVQAQYVPDSVKAPKVIKAALAENAFGLSKVQLDAVNKALDAVQADATKAWKERQERRARGE